MDPQLDAALQRASYLYLTTYGASGKSGTVPVWCWYDGRDAYFTTHRESLKARRIRETGRVRARVGAPDGPAFEGHAEWVDGRVISGHGQPWITVTRVPAGTRL